MGRPRKKWPYFIRGPGVGEKVTKLSNLGIHLFNYPFTSKSIFTSGHSGRVGEIRLGRGKPAIGFGPEPPGVNIISLGAFSQTLRHGGPAKGLLARGNGGPAGKFWGSPIVVGPKIARGRVVGPGTSPGDFGGRQRGLVRKTTGGALLKRVWFIQLAWCWDPTFEASPVCYHGRADASCDAA